MRLHRAFLFGFAALKMMGTVALAGENYEDWPLLVNPFPSTGGGGIMIDGYKPILKDGKCLTDFTAIDPSGAVYYNAVEFEQVETQGGVLCINGKWRALDGSASGTTPFASLSRTASSAARREEACEGVALVTLFVNADALNKLPTQTRGRCRPATRLHIFSTEIPRASACWQRPLRGFRGRWSRHRPNR